jgi:L-iditol 2-dehydrogenase
MIVPPAVFGHELAGVISEVGPGADNWRVGDPVVTANSAPCGECFYCQAGQENLCDDLLFLNGAYAESIVIPERLVRKNLLALQPTTAFVDAALAEPLACVVQGIEDIKPIPRDQVLVIGAGPIGLMFVSLLKHLGCRVGVIGRGEKRLSAAQRLGAETALDAGQSDWFDRARSAGRWDIVIEAVGKPETWDAAIRLVRKGGKVNLFGGCPSGTSVSLDTGLCHYSNLYLLASFHHTPATIRKALNYIEAGVIGAREFVDAACPLEGLPDLFRSMAAGNRAVKTWIQVRD